MFFGGGGGGTDFQETKNQHPTIIKNLENV